MSYIRIIRYENDDILKTYKIKKDFRETIPFKRAILTF
jgi:hypothetical protein